MKSLLVLGSTGSIGSQTLDVVRSERDRFRVEGLAAGSSWERVVAQAREFRPRVVALTDPQAAQAVREHLGASAAVLEGPEALQEIASAADYDAAVHGVVGAQGLPATVQALERGKEVALANKESLVIAGAELMELARSSGGTILPKIRRSLCRTVPFTMSGRTIHPRCCCTATGTRTCPTNSRC